MTLQSSDSQLGDIPGVQLTPNTHGARTAPAVLPSITQSPAMAGMRRISNTTQSEFLERFLGPSKGHQAVSGDWKMSLCPLECPLGLWKGGGNVVVFKESPGRARISQ